MTSRRRLSGHAADVAPRLLGAHLTSHVDGHRVVLRLTEVEAYGDVGEDPGSHAFRRQTARNATMFGPSGHLYVYFTYGMHWCANVVTGTAGQAGAVLLRAGEVVEGINVARSRRPRSSDRDLARGPARLCAALGITGDLDGIDLLEPTALVTIDLPQRTPKSLAGPRTGVVGGASTPWRFYLDDEPTVSPYRPAVTRRRS